MLRWELLGGCRWRGLFVRSAEEGQRWPSRGRSVLGACLPACLPLCCSEGGRGWACSCLGSAAPSWDTAPLWGDRLTASPHSPPPSTLGSGPAGQRSEREDGACLILQGEHPALWEAAREWPAGDSPEIAWGTQTTCELHLKGPHLKLCSGGDSRTRCHPAPGWSPARGAGV